MRSEIFSAQRPISWHHYAKKIITFSYIFHVPKSSVYVSGP